jgi:hypothetical protein
MEQRRCRYNVQTAKEMTTEGLSEVHRALKLREVVHLWAGKLSCKVSARHPQQVAAHELHRFAGSSSANTISYSTQSCICILCVLRYVSLVHTAYLPVAKLKQIEGVCHVCLVGDGAEPCVVHIWLKKLDLITIFYIFSMGTLAPPLIFTQHSLRAYLLFCR